MTALVLACDSSAATATVVGGQFLSDLVAALYLAALLTGMRPQRRLLALLFVPLSAVGEVIFTMVFRLYEYRIGVIPLYVPLGHSILLSVGLLGADQAWMRLHRRIVEQALVFGHGLLVGGAWLLYGDTLSAGLSIPFGAILCCTNSRSRTTYLVIGVLVLYVELLGTQWGCWAWHAVAFGAVHTVNPPPGAFVCYVIGEVIAVKVAAILAEAWSTRRSPERRLLPRDVTA